MFENGLEIHVFSHKGSKETSALTIGIKTALIYFLTPGGRGTPRAKNNISLMFLLPTY